MPGYNSPRRGTVCTVPKFLCCSMYCSFCVILCIVLLPPGGNPIAVNKYHIKKSCQLPCRRTVYRMVGNAVSHAYCWSKHEIQNLQFSQMRHGLHQTGMCTSSIAATVVTKVCLQFLDFLYVTLMPGPGLQ